MFNFFEFATHFADWLQLFGPISAQQSVPVLGICGFVNQ